MQLNQVEVLHERESACRPSALPVQTGSIGWQHMVGDNLTLGVLVGESTLDLCANVADGGRHGCGLRIVLSS